MCVCVCVCGAETPRACKVLESNEEDKDPLQAFIDMNSATTPVCIRTMIRTNAQCAFWKGRKSQVSPFYNSSQLHQQSFSKPDRILFVRKVNSDGKNEFLIVLNRSHGLMCVLAIQVSTLCFETDNCRDILAVAFCMSLT